MSSLLFILRRSLINIIKELFRKPAALIAYIVIALLFLISFIFSGASGSDAGINLNIKAVRAIFSGYTAFIFIIALSSSLAGTTFFRMADVNLLFTAPLNAGSILIYGFVKQLAVNLMMMAFLALQYPNWKRMFGLTDGAGWILMVAYLLLIAVSSLLGMVLYSYVTRKPGRKQTVKMLIYIGTFLFIAPILVRVFETKDILQSIVGWLSGDYIKYTPFIGWFTEILIGTVTGITSAVILNGSFVFVTLVIAFIYLYRMDTDFFEDTLAGTELKESAVASMREGKSGGANMNARRRYRKVNFRFRLEGSKAIFQKQMLEKQKTGFWLVSPRTFILTAVGLIAAYAMPIENVLVITILLAISAYAMLILSMIGTWEGELSKHYLYLIPAKPFNKMMAATLPEVLKTLIDGVVIFGVTGFALKVQPIIIVSVIGAFVTLGSVFTYYDVVLRRLFGRIHGNVLRVFLRIALLMLVFGIIIIPTIVIIGITENFALGFFTTTILNTCFALLFMALGVGLFANPELG